MPKPKNTPTQLARAIRLLRRLQGRRSGLPFADLQAELGVSRSQLRRDLLALEDAGMRLSIEQEEGRYGKARVRLLDPDTLRMAATPRERFTMIAARGVFDILKGTPFAEDIASLIDKLTERSTARERADLARLGECITYRPDGGIKEYIGKEDALDGLQTGVLHRRLVRFTYRQVSGRTSTGTMAPYAMVLYRNGLYVLAARVSSTGEHDPARVFAAERFRRAEAQRKTSFEVPESFSLDDYFDGAFGIISGTQTHHVVVEFSKRLRTEATTRRWHPTQTSRELASGRVRVEFEVTSLREVVSWVLSWGGDLRVVEPQELRNRVRKALNDSAALYQP